MTKDDKAAHEWLKTHWKFWRPQETVKVNLLIRRLDRGRVWAKLDYSV